MRHFFKMILSVFVLFSNSFSSQPDEFCGMQGTTTPSSQLGGRYKPASGTFKVLVIYAQFTDDNTDISNPNWVKGQAPTYMNGTVDETWSANPTSGSMTHFFNDMSINTYKVIGKEVSIIMPQTMQWYYNNNLRTMYAMNKIAIQTADAQVNYAEFDNWRYDSAYSHSNVADGNIDMIFVVWRNKNTSLGLWSGIGALDDWASNNPFTVEGGTKTIQTGYQGFNEPGSGVTIINGYYGSWWVYRGMQHELAHWFFGANEHHSPSGTWALLEGWGTPSGCANAFERYKLGWINFYTIDPASYSTPTTVNITLPDFITTGIAYRIKVPGGGTNEYFILENHQRISQFDVPDNNTSVSGVFVLHQTADIGSAVYVNSAEGKFNWSVPYQLPSIYPPYNPANLPVFQKGTSNRTAGYHRRQAIPWSLSGVPQTPHVIHYQLINGVVVKAGENGNPTVFTGTGKDQFDLTNNSVFTPASNPSADPYNNATKIGFEVTGISNGVYTLNIHIKNPEAASPAKPMDLAFTTNNQVTLSWTNNNESDRAYWEVWRKYFRSSFDQQDWTLIGTSTTPSFTDPDFQLNSIGDLYTVYYKIRTKDTQGYYSTFSDIISTSAYRVFQKGGDEITKRGEIPQEFSINQNYPNPFNPSTRISYSIPEVATVKITIFDRLGREVSTLINREHKPGYYSVDFDANGLSSGVYFYKVDAGRFSTVKKMILMK